MRYTVFSNGSFAPLDIRELGFARDPKVTRFGPGQRDSYIIHYVLKGKGVFNGVPVSAGEGFLISPDQLVSYAPDPQSPWEFLWIISFDPSMRQIFERFGADPQTGVFSFDPEGISALNKAAAGLISGKTRILDALSILETFLHILNSCLPAKSGMDAVKSASQPDLYLEFAEKYLDEQIGRPVTVQELTHLLGISQPYLHRIFSQKLLTSPKQYILSRKLLHAKKLLANTDLSVTEIAHSVGYDDPLTFSRLFCRKEGLSPTRYRESARPKSDKL